MDDRSPPASAEAPNEELPPPTGTLFLLMIYLMIMAGMWLAIYFDFLGR